MTEYRFQVNLKGVIELLSNHLYSGPQVFVREIGKKGDKVTEEILKFIEKHGAGKLTEPEEEEKKDGEDQGS